MSDLQGLLARVEAATGPDHKLDEDIWEAFGGRFDLFGPRWIYADGVVATERWTWLTASIDAALALVATALPGWAWSVTEFIDQELLGGRYSANFAERVPADGERHGSDAVHKTSAPLAILAALLRAKIAMTGGTV